MRDGGGPVIAMLMLMACVAACEQREGRPEGTGSSPIDGVPAAGAAGALAGSGVGGGGSGGSAGAVPTAPQAGAPAMPDASVMRDASVPLDAASPADASTSADAAQDAARPDASADDDRCNAARLDPANPPVALAVSGSLGTHDPALIAHDGVFHLWHTGPGVPGKTSTDLMRWEDGASAFGSNPGWIAGSVPGARDLWAPDVSHFGGRFHLYYSASTFGSNDSCIGHATRDAIDQGSWSDQGSVVCSREGDDDFNAIDPNVIVDVDGTPWLSFGSFWSGVKAVRLDTSGARADDEVHDLASRGGGAIEAPFIVRRCGFYYLFVSFDCCCDGASSTYNTRVGRSENVLGPYVDKAGMAMMQGGGTLLVTGAGRWHGPGHNAVIWSGTRAYNVFHAYDANSGGRSSLRVAELAWDEAGWPVSGGP